MTAKSIKSSKYFLCTQLIARELTKFKTGQQFIFTYTGIHISFLL